MTLISFSRRLALICAFAFPAIPVAISTAHAQSALPEASRHQAPTTPEQAFVYQVADEVLHEIRQQPDEASTQTALEGIFTRYVDIEWVGRFVLGRHWRAASQQQQQAFITNYRKFMVGGYTTRLRQYSGESYKVAEPRQIGQGRSSLTMQVSRQGGAPLIIDYKIRESGGGYKIYDLVVEGISLITTQRSEFDSVVNRKGLDFLIQALAKKAAKPAV